VQPLRDSTPWEVDRNLKEHRKVEMGTVLIAMHGLATLGLREDDIRRGKRELRFWAKNMLHYVHGEAVCPYLFM
jgi:hypothetical protein